MKRKTWNESLCPCCIPAAYIDNSHVTAPHVLIIQVTLIHPHSYVCRFTRWVLLKWCFGGLLHRVGTKVVFLFRWKLLPALSMWQNLVLLDAELTGGRRYLPLLKWRFVVSHTISQTDIPASLDCWVANTPSVKMLCPPNYCMSLFFRRNVTCLSDRILRIRQVLCPLRLCIDVLR